MIPDRGFPARVTGLVLMLAVVLGWTNLSPASDRYYSLHVGSYKTAGEAEREAARLASGGLTPMIRLESVKGKGRWRRVYVGAFDTPDQAVEAGRQWKSRQLIPYYRVTAMTGPKPSPVRAPKPKPTSKASEPDFSAVHSGPDQAFKKIVYGRYVASFKYRHLAEAEAEGLTRFGWPASVSEERVRGVMWYRVYLLPPGGRAGYGLAAGELRGFDILADMSGSPGEFGRTGPPRDEDEASSCPEYSRYGARLELLRRINRAVPAGAFQAGLRESRFKVPKSPADLSDNVKIAVKTRGRTVGGFSALRWGVLAYNREDFGRAVEGIRPCPQRAPLSLAVAATTEDLAVIPDRKALIIISDFNRTWDFDDPVEEARKLVDRYGDGLCLYVISLDASAEGLAAARAMAAIAKCGRYYDGCRLLADAQYFQAMIRDIFQGFLGAGCDDRDGDGVCDDQDRCPRTPRGALVDKRGCWMAALAPFFDFDQARVKKEYLPGLKWAADIILENPGILVEVAGHTDSVGTGQYNMKLGMRRAVSVRKWLLHYGVDPGRLRLRSYGETKPLVRNDSAMNRARNRRVELHVLK